MDAPLWTEMHTPGLDDLPRSEVRDRPRHAVNEPMNLVMQDPPGVGKIAAIRVLAREAHADPENDLIKLNVVDFSNRTKKQIRADLRFEQFLDGRNRVAKRDTINRVLKESADYVPVSGEYRTIILDDAGSIHEDSQQALRHVMGQRRRTTQFVITTRQPSKLTPPICSRCFPVPMPAPDDEALEALLVDTLDVGGVNYDTSGLQFLIDASSDNVRKTIFSAQQTATEADEVTMSTVRTALGDVGFDDGLKTLLISTREGGVKDARETLTTLLGDEGYEGQELLVDIPRVANSTPERFADDEFARLHELAGRVDLDISMGVDGRLYITYLLTSWGADTRGET